MGCFVPTMDRNRRGGEQREREEKRDGERGRGRGRVPTIHPLEFLWLVFAVSEFTVTRS